MNRTIRALVALSGAAALASAAVSPALADDEVIEGRLRACQPGDPAIGGIAACSRAWKLRAGTVDLERDGELEVDLKGLVPADGASGATAVALALVCAGEGGPVVAAPRHFELAPRGTAHIETRLALPPRCLAPTVVVRDFRDGVAGDWIAVSGY